jgi:ferric-dicitrate binding protein FerR (iron transport regulator)
MQITIGDLGAIVGVLIYRPAFAKDHYRKPHIIAIGYLLFAIGVAGALWWYMQRENRRRDEVLNQVGEKREHDIEDEQERIRLGDRHIKWRYQV